MRKAFSEVDLSLAKLEAFLRLASYLQECDDVDRQLLHDGEAYLIEAMISESQKARRAFNRGWGLMTTMPPPTPQDPGADG